MDCVRSWAVPMATATGCLHGPVDHRRTTVAVFPSISITSLVSVRFAYTFPSPIPPAPCTTTHSPPRTAACLSPHETRPYSDTPCLRSQQTRWNRAGEPGSHRHSARRRIPRMRPNKKHQGRAALPSHRPVLRAPTYCSHATSKGYARRCIRPCSHCGAQQHYRSLSATSIFRQTRSKASSREPLRLKTAYREYHSSPKPPPEGAAVDPPRPPEVGRHASATQARSSSGGNPCSTPSQQARKPTPTSPAHRFSCYSTDLAKNR